MFKYIMFHAVLVFVLWCCGVLNVNIPSKPICLRHRWTTIINNHPFSRSPMLDHSVSNPHSRDSLVLAAIATMSVMCKFCCVYAFYVYIYIYNYFIPQSIRITYTTFILHIVCGFRLSSWTNTTHKSETTIIGESLRASRVCVCVQTERAHTYVSVQKKSLKIIEENSKLLWNARQCNNAISNIIWNPYVPHLKFHWMCRFGG